MSHSSQYRISSILYWCIKEVMIVHKNFMILIMRRSKFIKYYISIVSWEILYNFKKDIWNMKQDLVCWYH